MLMGLKEEDLKELDVMYWGWTEKSMRANLLENYTYRANPALANSNTKV